MVTSMVFSWIASTIAPASTPLIRAWGGCCQGARYFNNGAFFRPE